jgi:hypothetical protein
MGSVLRTQATDETRGFMKVLVGADDRILGFTMIGSEAGEVMAAVQTAMLAGLPYQRTARRDHRASDDSRRPRPALGERAAAPGAIRREISITGKLANKVALVTGSRWDRSRLTGSIASIKGFPSFSVYNASKAAVRSFARSLIADLKGRAIRIKVLSPAMSRRRTCPA